MRLISVPRWQTSDGSEYDDRGKAVAHECELRMAEILNLTHCNSITDPELLWSKRGEIMAIYARLESSCEGERGYLRMSMIAQDIVTRARAYVVRQPKETEACSIIMALVRLADRLDKLDQQRGDDHAERPENDAAPV
jgi:hypothetical protein